MDIEARLSQIEELLRTLVAERQSKDFYSVNEVAARLGKAPFTVREACRLGRCRAIRRRAGRGEYGEWMISHEELTRIQNEGWLPDPNIIRRRRR
jgi:hypothetical protein